MREIGSRYLNPMVMSTPLTIVIALNFMTIA
jgi:hypothetical protein